MKYDKPLVAALMGCLATIPAEAATRIFLAAGAGRYSIFQLDSLFVTYNRPNTLIGFIVSSAVGGLIAVLLYLSLKRIGQDHIVIKCLFASIFAWVVLESASAIVIETRAIELRPINDYYVHMFGAIVYGAVLGLLFRRFLLEKESTQHS